MDAKITKAQYDALNPVLQGEYVPSGDGYTLKLEGGYITDNDPQVVLNARDHEKEARKKAEAELKEYKDAEAKKKADEEAAKKKAEQDRIDESGDLAGFRQEVNQMFAEKDAAHKEEVDALKKTISDGESRIREGNLDSTVSRVIGGFKFMDGGARDYATHQVRAMLTHDENGNVVVAGPDGKPAIGKTVENLSKDIVDSKKFDSIIVGSHGRGGRTEPSKSGAPVDVGDKKFGEMTSTEKGQLWESDRATYERLSKEHQEQKSVEPVGNRLGKLLQQANTVK